MVSGNSETCSFVVPLMSSSMKESSFVLRSLTFFAEIAMESVTSRRTPCGCVNWNKTFASIEPIIDVAPHKGVFLG